MDIHKPEKLKVANWPERDWKTVRMIGCGSFGTVYEIEREVFGEMEKCAMKHISIPRSEDEVREMRAERMSRADISKSFADQAKEIVAEYSRMKKLINCPNVVVCHDVKYIQKNDGYGWDIYIRMELLTPLMSLLSEDTTWTETQIVELGKDICNALVFCERERIIHRDIKPQNIMVSESGQYKLGDFGISRALEGTSASTAGIGTDDYMAPEVHNGNPYDTRADICSLGLVLYWLLNER